MPAASPDVVPALALCGLVKRFGATVAVDGIDLTVPTGSFYGLVGPNGAGKTTTLSMATGLLRPDAGTASVHGVDVWSDPAAAKRMIGNLADGVRLFDRLTGEQLIAPGIATALGAASALVAWGRWPIALLAALVCLPLGVLTCLLASRTVASFSGRGRGRIGNAVALLAFAALVLTGPILTGLLGLLGEGSAIADRIGLVVAGTSWTPVGAVWAVPGELAAGAYAEGLVKLFIAIATLAALWLLWRRNVVAASVAPRRRSAGGRSGRLGWIGLAPTGATAAGWARSLSYWLGDPRYARNLVIVAVLPVLFAFALGWHVQTPVFAFAVVVPALLLGLVPYTDVSYDGSAFATVLATSIRGRDDRAGRLLGALSASAPLVVVVAVATVALSGRWDLFPAVLGCALGALLAGLGICAVTSAYIVTPVPASGDNVFKRVPGQSAWVGFALMGFTALAAVLTAPAIALAAVAVFVGGALWSWLALVVGLVVGGALAMGGVVLGGRIFDRTGPLLLARVRATAGY